MSKAASAPSRLPRLLSVKAVSEATTLPLSSVYELIARGEIAAVRLGRSVRVDERDAVRFFESRREVAR